jgi:hypothetical protein
VGRKFEVKRLRSGRVDYQKMGFMRIKKIRKRKIDRLIDLKRSPNIIRENFPFFSITV